MIGHYFSSRASAGGERLRRVLRARASASAAAAWTLSSVGFGGSLGIQNPCHSGTWWPANGRPCDESGSGKQWPVASREAGGDASRSRQHEAAGHGQRSPCAARPVGELMWPRMGDGSTGLVGPGTPGGAGRLAKKCAQRTTHLVQRPRQPSRPAHGWRAVELSRWRRTFWNGSGRSALVDQVLNLLPGRLTR